MRWQRLKIQLRGGFQANCATRKNRNQLYMPALVAIRFNPPLKAKYLALRATGKSAKLAIVAIIRKLLIIANALLRDNRKWTLEIA
jgi:transposase